jgi:hypothetical protein
MGHGHSVMEQHSNGWLSRDELQQIIDSLSADDLIEATASKGTEDGGMLLLKVSFNRAAARAGFGEDATQHVRAADFQYLAKTLGGVVNAESPLSEGTEDLLASAASGE